MEAFLFFKGMYKSVLLSLCSSVLQSYKNKDIHNVIFNVLSCRQRKSHKIKKIFSALIHYKKKSLKC